MLQTSMRRVEKGVFRAYMALLWHTVCVACYHGLPPPHPPHTQNTLSRCASNGAQTTPSIKPKSCLLGRSPTLPCSQVGPAWGRAPLPAAARSVRRGSTLQARGAVASAQACIAAVAVRRVAARLAWVVHTPPSWPPPSSSDACPPLHVRSGRPDVLGAGQFRGICE